MLRYMVPIYNGVAPHANHAKFNSVGLYAHYFLCYAAWHTKLFDIAPRA